MGAAGGDAGKALLPPPGRSPRPRAGYSTEPGYVSVPAERSGAPGRSRAGAERGAAAGVRVGAGGAQRSAAQRQHLGLGGCG